MVVVIALTTAVAADPAAALAKNPHDDAAFAELVKRHDVEAELAKKPPEWSNLVVLGRLAQARGDNAAAIDRWQKAVALAADDAATWRDLGDALLVDRQAVLAADAYASAEKHAADAQHRVEAMARRGHALEVAGKDTAALVVYDRAIAAAPRGYYLETELLQRVVDIHRRLQTLPVLLGDLEARWPTGRRGFTEWNTLGRLYEETGRPDDAIAALDKAVATSPYELDAQRRLIQLLDNAGRAADALAHLEAVTKVAPGEVRFQLELADRYGHRDIAKAVAVLQQLERRFAKDAGVLTAVADMYNRLGKTDEAKAAFDRAAKLP